MSTSINPKSRQKGVVIAVLMWLLAALGLMVGGVVIAARVDAKLAQQQTQQASVRALGDGAVNLAMRQVKLLQLQREYQAGDYLALNFLMFERSISVRVVPASGLVSINDASFELLRQLFIFGAELDVEHAELLASAIESWRTSSLGLDAAGNPVRSGKFIAIEDLLLVPEMNSEIFEKIRLLIHPWRTSAGVSLRAATPAMLDVLASNQQGVVLQFLTERDMHLSVGTQGISAIPSVFVTDSLSDYARVDVRIARADSTIEQYSRWVRMGSEGRDGLPWRRLRAEPVIIVSSTNFLVNDEDAQWH